MNEYTETRAIHAAVDRNISVTIEDEIFSSLDYSLENWDFLLFVFLCFFWVTISFAGCWVYPLWIMGMMMMMLTKACDLLLTEEHRQQPEEIMTDNFYHRLSILKVSTSFSYRSFPHTILDFPFKLFISLSFTTFGSYFCCPNFIWSNIKKKTEKSIKKKVF